MPDLAGPLLEQLHRDADSTIAERTAQAHAEAVRIRDFAAAQRAHRRDVAMAEREREIARERGAARDAVAQSTVNDVLTARAAFLDRVFVRAETALDAIAAAPGFPRRLAPLLTDALRFVEAGEMQVRCAATSASAVRAILLDAGRGEVPVVVDDLVPAGAIVENASGTLRVDATFAALLRRRRPVVSIEAVRLMEATPT